MPSVSPTVAILDIGSNSIKILIARRDPATGQLTAEKYKTLDARISTGISKANPRLTEDAMTRGLAAIQELLADAAPFSPAKIILVATSAVRDAANGSDFRARVLAATGHPIRILSGDEEAALIGRGLTCDPALAHLRDFYVFDLGGGSLECLAFRDRQITQAVSLQLGCVRLTERFIADPAQPLSPETIARIAAHTRDTLDVSGFRFDLPPTAATIGTGGTVTTARTILGQRAGKELADTDTFVSTAQLRELLDFTGQQPLATRREIPGLPPARADVFPTALITLLALTDLGHFPGLHNSLYNLRWGLAADALSP
ncbi:phosphatase [Nibricoccus aquaticus]|uniref:Phosphatase n=1 Tax=Nibricoccus aquaticus TaxID=2576891 RepID=A0A290Q3D4_9BACT|nr:phosphatase [Nibricoccus aquaticus]ATC62807.1 phosphatase [Nibricoccus aquaticus]